MIAIWKRKIGLESIKIQTTSQTVLQQNLSNKGRFVLPIAQFKLILHLFENMVVAQQNIFAIASLQFVVITFGDRVFIEDLIHLALLWCMYLW